MWIVIFVVLTHLEIVQKKIKKIIYTCIYCILMCCNSDSEWHFFFVERCLAFYDFIFWLDIWYFWYPLFVLLFSSSIIYYFIDSYEIIERPYVFSSLNPMDSYSVVLHPQTTQLPLTRACLLWFVFALCIDSTIQFI